MGFGGGALEDWESSLLVYLDANAAVFHLAAVAFESDGAGGGEFEGFFEDFAIAGAAGGIAFGFDNEFVPVAGAVVFEFFPWSGEGEVATLELWFAEEDTAVSVWRGAEFEFESEVGRELAGGPELLDTATFCGGGDDKSAVDGAVAAVGCLSFSFESLGCVNEGPGDTIGIAFEPAFGGGANGVRRDLKTPASEVPAVKQTFEAWFGLEVIGFGFDESESGKDGAECAGPAAVAGFVGVEQVGHVFRFCVTFGAGKERPCIEDCDLGIAASDSLTEQIDVPDAFRRAFFGCRAGEDEAENDRGVGA